jgi:hypothetical protein
VADSIGGRNQSNVVPITTPMWYEGGARTFVGRSGIEQENCATEMEDLETAVKELDAVLIRMEKAGKRVQSGPERPDGDGLHGLNMVPTAHADIFIHSIRSPRTRFVWINKSLMIDENGNLGYPATSEEVRRFGGKARKVFLVKPPSILQKSFVEASMGWEDDRPAK